jgi:hypothetical protein
MMTTVLGTESRCPLFLELYEVNFPLILYILSGSELLKLTIDVASLTIQIGFVKPISIIAAKITILL